MDTVTSRLLSRTNFWSMWKMGPHAGMWSKMTHKSSFISSVVLAEKDELLFFHLIHMSICLLFVPLSKDYWCPAFDIWHISQCSFSSSELTQKKNANLTAISSQALSLFFCAPKTPHLPDIEQTGQRALWVPEFGGKLFIWPLHVSAIYNLLCVIPVSSTQQIEPVSPGLDFIFLNPPAWTREEGGTQKQAQHIIPGLWQHEKKFFG